MFKSLDIKKETIYRLLFLPAIFVWCELVLHIADGAALKYSPIYFFFAISAACVLNLLPALLPGRKGRIAEDVLSLLLPFVFSVEFVAKVILQTYYPLSTLGTAVDNKLFQFAGIIVTKTLQSIPVILLLFLPSLLVFLARAKGGALLTKLKEGRFRRFLQHLAHKGEAEIPRRSALLLLACFAAFHLLGLACVYWIPWNADVTPRALYESDTDFNYQVEELGLYSFLRLDVRHMLVPAKTEEVDFADLQMPERPAAESADTSEVADAGEGADASFPEAEPIPEDPEEEPIDTSPNVMDVDFAALRENTNKKDIQWLCDYFSSVTPTNKNEYTGLFEGYNVVFITVEALSGYAISEEYTPTLWKLQHEGFHFNNFYTALHYTSTSNGECQNLLGLYPKNGNPISMKRTGELKDNMYFSLAQQLGRLGYKNWGYHDNWDLYGRMTSHSNLGYYWQFSYRGLTGDLKSNGDLEWPQKDTVMIDESIGDYAEEEEPFNVYYLTVSGHVPFGWNWATAGYKDALEEAPYSTLTKGYVASVMECDRAVQKIIDGLDAAGKLENTLFVIAPDHIPYANVEVMEELSGKELGSSDAARAINESSLDPELYHSALCIWSASMEEPVEVDKVCCQVDILPTVSNLLGLEYDSRMLSGSDILSTAEGMVVFSSRSWLTDRGFYNRFKQSFVPAEGVEMSEEELTDYVERTKTLAACRLDCTARIIENDFYNYVFGETTERIYGEIAPKN